MTMDNLKKSWATASPADPIAKPAQSATERMRAYRQGMKRKTSNGCAPAIIVPRRYMRPLVA